MFESFEPADQPFYDPEQFKAECIDRARQFSEQVQRLAPLHSQGESTALTQQEGKYTVAGKTLEAVHEIHDDGQVAMLRITRDPIGVSDCNDGLLRQVVWGRDIYYSSRPVEEPASDTALDPAESRPLTRAEIEREKMALEAVDRAQFADSVDPNFRPPELILAETTAIVGCEQPGTNPVLFRLDRRPEGAELSEWLLLRQPDGPGDAFDGPRYTVNEHDALMPLLNEIQPGDAEHLGYSPGSDWMDTPPYPKYYWGPQQI